MICPQCGGELRQVGDKLYYCKECDEDFEEDELKGELE